MFCFIVLKCDSGAPQRKLHDNISIPSWIVRADEQDARCQLPLLFSLIHISHSEWLSESAKAAIPDNLARNLKVPSKLSAIKKYICGTREIEKARLSNYLVEGLFVSHLFWPWWSGFVPLNPCPSPCLFSEPWLCYWPSLVSTISTGNHTNSISIAETCFCCPQRLSLVGNKLNHGQLWGGTYTECARDLLWYLY